MMFNQFAKVYWKIAFHAILEIFHFILGIFFISNRNFSFIPFLIQCNFIQSLF